MSSVAPPQVLPSPMLRRVAVLQARVMFACNNQCFFCLDRSEADGLFHGGPSTVPFAHVERVLRAQAGRLDAVMFTHGEPTLHPQLPELARLAVELGYATRGVVSNGRRLSDPAYARELVEAGVNRFVLSIHGPDAQTHDACVGRRAFHQASAGLQAVRQLKRSHGVQLTTSTVVSRLNLHKLADTLRFLLDHDVDTAVLNVVRPTGNAARFFDKVVPRHGEVVAVLEQVFAQVPAAKGRVAVEDIPPCAARTIAPMLGVLEAWVAEPSDESPEAPVATADLASLPAEQALTFEEGLPQDRSIKREACRQCAHDGQCWGVWSRYVQAYGWDGFDPVGIEDLEQQSTSPFASLVLELAGTAVIAAAVAPHWQVEDLELDARRDRARYALRHADGRRFRLGLEPADPTRPAFARTAVFNLAYHDRQQLLPDEAAALRQVQTALQVAESSR